jgi:hypothetical protein
MENKDIWFWLLFIFFVLVVINSSEEHKDKLELQKQLDESYVTLNKAITDTRNECK